MRDIEDIENDLFDVGKQMMLAEARVWVIEATEEAGEGTDALAFEKECLLATLDVLADSADELDAEARMWWAMEARDEKLDYLSMI